ALSLGNDVVMNAISSVLSRTIFSIRPYSAKFVGLEKDLPRWGAYMRKLSIADSDWADDEAYKYPVTYDASENPPTGDGGMVDQWKIKKPNVLQTNFYGASVFADHITIFEDQLESAFRSPEELGSFISLIMTNLSNRIEMSRDAVARGLVANMIGALLTENDANRVVHLLTEYNAQTGLTLTAQSVYSPDNFPSFMKWVYSRVAQISDLMTENSLMFQTVISGKPVLRHTPMQNQKIYLYSPARHQMDARVLADTYHDNYLKYADVESVNYWQSIKTPDSINISPAYTSTAGAVVNGDAVSKSGIFGLMFDEDAMGYALLDRRMVPTPVNASGLYRNIFIHAKQKVFMDNTEKAVVLLLD
ncbi:MAG: hypothetical protein IIZ93_13975, partial [Acidaminococcaceae bacterium]|nr:hypothetical protein [Acidaminococcaceae bacterium]